MAHLIKKKVVPKKDITTPSPKGKNLKDYKILPDFALVERIASKKESAKTDFPQRIKNIEGTALASDN